MRLQTRWGQAVDTSIRLANYLIVVICLMLGMTLVSLLIINGGISNIDIAHMEENVVAALFVTTIPMLIALTVIPYFWERRNGASRTEMLLVLPKGKWNMVFTALNVFLAGWITVVFLLRHGVIFPIVNFAVIAVSEEFFFRGVLLHRIRKASNTLLAVLITSILFAFVLHINEPVINNLLYRLPIGLVYGFVAVRTKSLLTPILLHYSYNLYIMS